MPARTITLEVHELDSRTGQHCGACDAWAVVEVDLAIVASDTLQVLTHATGSLCTMCGCGDTWRS